MSTHDDVDTLAEQFAWDGYERTEIQTLIMRERSDERSATIKDMRHFIANGLHQHGIDAPNEISLTETVELVRFLVETLQRIAAYESLNTPLDDLNDVQALARATLQVTLIKEHTP